SLTQENVSAELDYLRAPGREGFERPYGLAWILELASEVGQSLEPLEKIAAERLVQGWEKLTVPVRSGEHSQTGFAMGLAWDWACLSERLAGAHWLGTFAVYLLTRTEQR